MKSENFPKNKKKNEEKVSNLDPSALHILAKSCDCPEILPTRLKIKKTLSENCPKNKKNSGENMVENFI